MSDPDQQAFQAFVNAVVANESGTHRLVRVARIRNPQDDSQYVDLLVTQAYVDIRHLTDKHSTDVEEASKFERRIVMQSYVHIGKDADLGELKIINGSDDARAVVIAFQNAHPD